MYEGTTTSTVTTINSDGSFTFSSIISTLPGIKIALSDSLTYGSGYIETPQITLSSVCGPVNPILTTSPYAIITKSAIMNITLSVWNSSYPAGLYVYLGSDISTVVYSFGRQLTSLNSSTYSINFTGNVPNTINTGTYNLYISDQDPTDIRIPVVNQFVSIFKLYSEIVITSIIPTPNPIVTYTGFSLAGTLSNWLPSVYPSSLNLFYTTIYDSNVTRVSTTINPDGTFAYSNTETTLPGITISLSDSLTYGSGYLESNTYTLYSIPASVNAVLSSNPYAILNKSTSYNITLTIR
jgi:hypothetical protein